MLPIPSPGCSVGYWLLAGARLLTLLPAQTMCLGWSWDRVSTGSAALAAMLEDNYRAFPYPPTGANGDNKQEQHLP